MTIKKRLTEHAHIFTAVLLIIQPLLDIISFWFEKFGLSGGITLVLRLGVLGATLLYAYIITDQKWLYWITCSVIILLYTGHVFAMWQAGMVSIVSDFANYIRVIQMPVCTISIITFIRKNKNGFEGLLNGMTVALWITLAVMIISVVTGTDPGMYNNGTNFYNSGILGWFNNTNSQSSNLSVLLPVAFVTLLNAKRRRNFLVITTLTLGLLALFFACTRLAYLGIVAVTVGLGVSIIIVKRTQWKYAVTLLAFAVIFAVLIPYSPMTQHLNIYNDQQVTRQEWLNAKIQDVDKVKSLLDKKNEDPRGQAPGSTEDNDGTLSRQEYEELVKQLAPVYKTYSPDFVQLFGLERTMEMYNYTTDIRTLSAVRAKKLMFATMLMDVSPDSSRIFGLELARFTVSDNIYDVENDFHGIYYLYGYAGLGAYFAFLLYFVGLIIYALIKNIKKYFTVEAAAFGISFLVCMAHAYNTAGVLRRPNASIFLSATLAGIYYLVMIKEYDETPALPKITDIFKKKASTKKAKKEHTIQ